MANTTLINSGTVDLWYLLCYLLCYGNLNNSKLNIPQSIDVGYFDDNINVTTTTINNSDSLPNTANAGYHSIVASGGSLFVNKNILTEEGTSNPVLEVTSYFSAGNFVNKTPGKELYLTLKSGTADTPILAIVDTGSNSYNISENETHIIKWQLSFQNVAAKNSTWS